MSDFKIFFDEYEQYLKDQDISNYDICEDSRDRKRFEKHFDAVLLDETFEEEYDSYDRVYQLFNYGEIMIRFSWTYQSYGGSKYFSPIEVNQKLKK